MQHLSQILIETLLHSIWQSALLLLSYHLVHIFFPRQSPLMKRNTLLVLLLSQLLLSVISFIFLHHQNGFNPNAFFNPVSFKELLPADLWTFMAPYLTALYVVALMLRLINIRNQWALHKKNLVSSFIKAPVDLKLFVQKTAIELNIKKDVTLWISKNISTPMTYGFLKPVIILPFALVNHLSLKETEMLILHELSHIKSNDYLLNWFLVFAEQVYFFNPFTRNLIKQVKLQREKACDLRVIQYQYPSIQYAETLLKTARHSRSPYIFQVPAVSSQSQLMKRMLFFTNANKTDKIVHHRSPVMLTKLAAVSIAIFSIMQLSGKKELTGNMMAFRINNTKTNVNEYPKKGLKTSNKPMVVMISDEDMLKNVATKKYTDRSKKSAPVESVGINMADDIAAADQTLRNENPLFQVIPVSEKSNELSKEFIIKDEDPLTGTTVTRAFRLSLIDGEWQREFLWMMTETKPKADSLVLFKSLLLIPELL